MHSPDEERRSRRIRMPRRWWTRLTLAGLVLAALLAPAAWANHQFSDVPTASPHHADISAIASVGITGGCAPGLYCPTQAVQRDQMASFIRRGLPRAGSAGTTAGVTLTSAFQSIASDSITSGGSAGGGSGFVVLMGSATFENPSGNMVENHRIEFRLREVQTGFLSNTSSTTLQRIRDPLPDAIPTDSVMKQWQFTIPTGTTRTYSIDARVAFPGSPNTVLASNRLMTVMYVPFGPSGTSSPLGSPGEAVSPSSPTAEQR